MSWLKDNLILLLAIATLALGVGWVLDHYIAAARYAELEADFSKVEGHVDTLERTNEDEVAKLVALQAQYNAIVERNKVDAERLAQATQRITALNKEVDAQLAANRALRDQLALENPYVDAYMRTGMPCALADSLWPGAYDCP